MATIPGTNCICRRPPAVGDLPSAYHSAKLGPNMFSWIRYYRAEVCALPSALVVDNVITSRVFKIQFH